MRVVVRDRKHNDKVIVELDMDEKNSTILELKKEIHRVKSKLSVERQRITLLQDAKVPLTNEARIFQCIPKDLSSGNVLEVCVKDLGPQIGWKTVFLAEYFGPILVHSLFFFARVLIFTDTLGPVSGVARLCYGLAVFHYGKRELETLFVHRFSNDTMPFMNLFKNCFHYFVLGGVLIAYPTYFMEGQRQDYSTMMISRDGWVMFWTFVFFYAQVSNLYTHITLSNLRPPGTRIRNIPTGYGFNLVSCANYFFELLAWISYSMIAGNAFCWFFTLVSGVQMGIWAMKKHKAYIKEFPNYPKGRKAMIPFIY